MCRLHALSVELAPGGIAEELYVSNAERFLANITPQSPTEQVRYGMALELLDLTGTQPFFACGSHGLQHLT